MRNLHIQGPFLRLKKLYYPIRGPCIVLWLVLGQYHVVLLYLLHTIHYCQVSIICWAGGSLGQDKVGHANIDTEGQYGGRGRDKLGLSCARLSTGLATNYGCKQSQLLTTIFSRLADSSTLLISMNYTLDKGGPRKDLDHTFSPGISSYRLA